MEKKTKKNLKREYNNVEKYLYQNFNRTIQQPI